MNMCILYTHLTVHTHKLHGPGPLQQPQALAWPYVSYMYVACSGKNKKCVQSHICAYIYIHI